MTEPVQRLFQALGHEFAKPALLRTALTHRSAKTPNNERLEFLGDALLGFVIGEELYCRFPSADEGKLTRIRASLVNRETLARLARELELGQFLTLGEGERKSGGWRRDSILANTMEAVLGAIYEDAGFEVAKQRLLALYESILGTISPDTVSKDAKTQLQEYLQAHKRPLPVYEVVALRGEPHEQTFIVKCTAAGSCEPVEAEGTSRRRAEQAVAGLLMEKLRSEK